MNAQALNEMIRVLETVQADQDLLIRFSLEDWFDPHSFVSLHTLEQSFDNAEQAGTLFNIPHRCGATACACGYAGLDPWFRERGFKTTPDGKVILDGQTDVPMRAVMHFFGLTLRELSWLFVPNRNDTATDAEDLLPPDAPPSAVIDRIRRLLAGEKIV